MDRLSPEISAVASRRPGDASVLLRDASLRRLRRHNNHPSRDGPHWVMNGEGAEIGEPECHRIGNCVVDLVPTWQHGTSAEARTMVERNESVHE